MSQQIVISEHVMYRMKQKSHMDKDDIYAVFEKPEGMGFDPEYNDGRKIAFREIHDFRARKARIFHYVIYHETSYQKYVITACDGTAGYILKKGLSVSGYISPDSRKFIGICQECKK